VVTTPVAAVVAPVAAVVSSLLKPIAEAASTLVFNTLRVKATTEVAPLASDGNGAVRIPCGYSHMAFDDPIVFPGQPGASHLHTFFGNTSTNANSTTESLFANKGSTCNGGIMNLTAYWIPAMVDTTNNRALIPMAQQVYYKKGYNNIPVSSMRAPPNGLRMIGGNKATQATELPKWESHMNFECWGADGTSRSGQVNSIPTCAPGGYIRIMLEFENCWDGVNLDSPDHRSHVAYTTTTCPASHPVGLPQIGLNIDYKVEAYHNTAKWRLASDNYATTIPAGYSMHADVWINWQEDIKQAWFENCVKAGKDCHSHLLGDGRTYY
jgi:hypothetical protein